MRAWCRDYAWVLFNRSYNRLKKEIAMLGGYRVKLFVPAALMVLLPGCFSASGLSAIRDQIEREVPEAEFKRQAVFTVGPMSLGLAKLVSRFVPNIQQPRAYLKQVHKVKMAVFENRSKNRFGLPRKLEQALKRQGWETLFRVNEPDDGSVWVLYRTDGRTVDSFYVLALDDETMVLVEMQASLDRIIERALGTSRALAARDADDNGSDDSDSKPLAFWEMDLEKLLAEPAGDSARMWEGRNTTLPDFWEVQPESLHWRYNRVDGFYLGWRLPRQYSMDLPTAYYSEFGYAVNDKTVRLQVGGEAFPWDDPARLGIELHDLTATQDQWVIGSEENNLSALFFKRDLRDYFRRWGGSLYLSRPVGSFMRLEGRLAQDKYESLDNAVAWSVFGGGWARRHFRSNPAVDEVRLRRFEADLVWDTRDRRMHPRQGWLGQVEAIAAEGFLKGDRSFRRLVGDLRRYQMLGSHTRSDLRLRLGRATGTLPAQHLFDLGGFSSLRGYRFKEFSGDRMVLFNGELWFDAHTHWLGGSQWDGLNLGAFFDAGAAWFSDKSAYQAAVGASAFTGLQVRDEPKFNASAGVGLDFEDIRLYVARPLDTNGADWQVSMRLSRSF